MKRTNIYLDQMQMNALDELARSRGISRAELIRRILDRAIHDGESDTVAEQVAAIEASFGVLRGDVDLFMRGPDERARHLERIAQL